MSEYEELAARRYRQYKWEKRVAGFKRTMAGLAFGVFQHAVPFLEQTGVTKKRVIEKVSVE